VGIMPRNFVFLYPEVRFWVPLAFTAKQKAQYHNNGWENIGRLKPGATVSQVQAQINALNAANLERFPELKTFLINAGFYTKVEPLQHMLVKDIEGSLYLLWGGAVCVLLMGGLNIANLALARWSVRGKEIATRLALGAGRAQLARQLIVENVLLAGAGGTVGVLLGSALLRAVAMIGLEHFPRANEVQIDGTVVIVALGLAVAFGGLALFLSAVGIYGVLAYLVAQRRREIAIRMALGSTGAGVVRLVLREGAVLVGIGLAAGFAGAAALQSVVANQIYGVRPLDPLVIGGVTALLGTIALAACAVPAWRAVQVDPVSVLKQE
jgi:ABC-type antimicrobial peptide transport system permease subunit